MLRSGFVHVRYGDDIAVVARTRDQAIAGFNAAERAAALGGQKLGNDKTEVACFADGFAYLGEEFNNRYPRPEENPRRVQPHRRTLHVSYQGAGIRLSKGRVVVSHDDSTLLSVPQSHVGRVVTSGSVGVSSGLRSWALHDGVDIVLLSRRGSFLGSLESARTAEAWLRRAQYRLTDARSWGLPIAKAMCFGKLTNQRTLLLRYARRDNARELVEIVEELERYRDQIAAAEAPDELMGIEGIAARRYWEGVSMLLADSDAGFRGRVRNPPTDVVNAALGYGYAILLGECVTAIRVVGLDEAAGVFHADHERRPSLALDLMEEYRPVIVDSVVIEAFRRRRLTIDHGRTDDRRPDGVLLTAKGVRALVKAIEDRLLTQFKHPGLGHKMTYRRSIRQQAVQLARSVRTGTPQFDPVLWRA